MNMHSKKTAIGLCLLASLAGATLALAQTGSMATPAKPASAVTQPAARPAPAPAPAQQPSAIMLFSRWDKDKNNTLSLAEFQTGWGEVETAMTLRKLQETFALKDANKSGGLEAAEYAGLDLIKKAGSSAPPMAKFDTDKNQRLDFKEYVAMLGELLSKP